MKEIWKDIEDYEGYYQVSNLGRIKALPRETNNQYKFGRFMTLQVNNVGYYYVDLSIIKVRKRYNVHRLVAKAFIENPLNKPCVNHIDGNKLNNRVDNLEWCSFSENTRHAIRTGLLKIEFTEEHLNKIRQRNIERCSKPIKQIKNGIVINIFQSQCEAQRKTGINQRNISTAIRNNKRAGGYNWEFVK